MKTLRVGVFSEVGHPDPGTGHFSGVSNFLRYNIRFCREADLPMDLHAYTKEDRVDTDGPVTLFGWKPRLAFPVDPTIPQDATHFLRDRRILARARERGYDVVNVVAPGTMGFQGVAVARRLALPVVAMYTTCLPEYAGKRTARGVSMLGAAGRAAVRGTERAGWGLMRWFYSHRNNVRTVLAPTRRIAEEIEGRLEPPIDILGRGVDVDLFRPAARDDLAARRGPVTLLFSGRIHRGEKGLDRLVEIAAAVPDVRFLIVGDGPHRRSLERDLGPRAEFTGVLSGEPLAAAYRRADMFVFPSKHDTFGQVVMEAMATGLPVVVTDQGGPQELVDDGVTGFVADDDLFIERVEALASSSDQRLRMGRAGRLAAEARRWSHVFQRLWRYYEAAAGWTSEAAATPDGAVSSPAV